MTRLEAWLLQISAILTTLSGLAVAVAKYLLPAPADAFTLSRPWESWALAVHVLAAPLFLFAVGVILRRHVLTKLRDPRASGRASGSTLAWLLAPLALSGYLLQVSTSERLRQVLALLHLGLGVVYAVAYAAHARQRSGHPALADIGAAAARATSLDSLRKRRR